jgi:DNA-directed RNA polymerase specialized sigma24 family protein
VVHALKLYDERRWHELVDDLTQEVWCRLLERRALARCRTARAATRRRYLRTIATHVVVDSLRLRGARKRRPAALLSLELAGGELARHAASGDCPERRLLAREQLRALVSHCRAVVGADCSAERWRVVRLGLFEGRPSSEIARGLGGRWSVIAIDSFLARLRQRLDVRGVRVACRPRGRSVS